MKKAFEALDEAVCVCDAKLLVAAQAALREADDISSAKR